MKPYYEQVHALGIESGFIEFFKEDVTIHDRRYLDSYNGPLLWGMRKAGSNSLKMGQCLDLDEVRDSLAACIWFVASLEHNIKLFYAAGGASGWKLKPVTKNKALELIEAYAKSLQYPPILDEVTQRRKATLTQYIREGRAA